ncbi:MAG: Ldh family oxidoreductase [Coprothermobacterota bacterium]|nr:Ldh family oxidoreductase [Coprothermobacterota bacterium]
MKNDTLIPVLILERFMRAVFTALGVPPEDAAVAAEVLIASDLRGIESHGVSRLKYYYDRIVAGVQQVRTQFEVVRESETTALVDGHHGMGQVIARRAMSMAIEKAKAHGLGAVAVRNGAHFGIAGYYSLMAAEEGMIGLAVTNARPSITPTFGVEPMLGTNPIAFAAPSDLDFPFSFDGATSIVQRGKLEVYARTGKPLNSGWVIDRQGEPLTDPKIALAGLDHANAALLPLGGAGEEQAGYKGYDLATMVEILSASLAGGPFLKGLLGVAEDGTRCPTMLGHFFLAIDISRFLPVEASKATTGGILRALQQSAKAPGEERIFVAGEKEHESIQRRQAEGVPLNEGLRGELRQMAEALQISGYEVYF